MTADIIKFDAGQSLRRPHPHNKKTGEWNPADRPVPYLAPAPSRDAWLDGLLLYVWSAGRKAGLPDGDPAPAAYEMQWRLDVLRKQNGLPPTLIFDHCAPGAASAAMSRRSCDKGARIEREVVNLSGAAVVGAERPPPGLVRRRRRSPRSLKPTDCHHPFSKPE